MRLIWLVLFLLIACQSTRKIDKKPCSYDVNMDWFSCPGDPDQENILNRDWE